MTASPFDDLRALLSALPEPKFSAAPDPALGRLGEIAAFLAVWRGGAGVSRPIVALYAGSTGADSDGVRAALEAVASGGSAAAAIAQGTGAGLEAFDLAIDRPAGDMSVKATMSERECAATMAFGMEALAKTPDLLMPAVLGDDKGAAAAAIALALFGGEASDWSDQPLIGAAVARARGEGTADPLDWLRQLGGRQIAAVAGAIIAARTQGVPVLLDGYAAAAAGAVLQAVQPRALDHCLAAQAGSAGHRRLLDRLGLKPVLDLGLPLEGGVAALTALQIVKAAASL